MSELPELKIGDLIYLYHEDVREHPPIAWYDFWSESLNESFELRLRVVSVSDDGENIECSGIAFNHEGESGPIVRSLKFWYKKHLSIWCLGDVGNRMIIGRSGKELYNETYQTQEQYKDMKLFKYLHGMTSELPEGCS